MKRYQFRLEQVQRVRRVQERLAGAALGAAQQAEADALIAEGARRAAAAARARPRGRYGAPQLLAERVVWDAELGALHQAEAARVAAGLRTHERRDDWLAASRRVRALELLDDRRREEHRHEADREEARRVDDLVAGRVHRVHAEGST